MAFDPRSTEGYDSQVGQRYSEHYDPSEGVPVAHASAAVRAGFLQKVYLTLSAGIAVSMAVGFTVLQQAISGDTQLLALVWGRPLITMIVYVVMAMAAGAVARVRGVNIVAYLLFTAVTGLLIAPLFLFAYIQAGNSYQVIWNAFGVTTLVFGGLTGYVLISKRDFSFLGGFLWVGLLVLLGFMVGTFFFQAEAFVMGVTLGGIALFALWVLYDTSVILHQLEASEWVAGALRLFVDFINIFIRILSLLSSRD